MSTCVIEVFSERLRASWSRGSPPEGLYRAAVLAASELYVAELTSRAGGGPAIAGACFDDRLFLEAILQSLAEIYSALPSPWRSGGHNVGAAGTGAYTEDCALGAIISPPVLQSTIRPYFGLQVQKEGLFCGLRERIIANFATCGHVPVHRSLAGDAYRSYLCGTALLAIFETRGPSSGCSEPARVGARP